MPNVKENVDATQVERRKERMILLNYITDMVPLTGKAWMRRTLPRTLVQVSVLENLLKTSKVEK